MRSKQASSDNLPELLRASALLQKAWELLESDFAMSEVCAELGTATTELDELLAELTDRGA